MSSRNAILKLQRAWALTAGRLVDARGYVPTIQENLRQPLSPGTERALTQGSGSELRETRNRPAKMRALHSSAALVVNIFDYWTLRDKAPLAAALGLEEQIISIEFEAQFPTHLDGKPPNLDLAIQTASGTTVAVESKFTEWLARKAANRKCFKPKYFPGGEALWEARGLAACQRLASQIDKGVEYFRYLDAPQLLKHALGLATQCSRPFFLHYFYFDYTCPESFSHRAEIDRFSSLVGSELGFRTLTFREFFQRLCGSTTLSDNEYIAYLRARYFENAAESDRSAKG